MRRRIFIASGRHSASFVMMGSGVLLARGTSTYIEPVSCDFEPSL